MEGPKNSNILDNYLFKALDIEDHMSSAVYGVYLLQSTWPANLQPEIFKKIVGLVEYLIQDTEKHKVLIKKLITKLHDQQHPQN